MLGLSTLAFAQGAPAQTAATPPPIQVTYGADEGLELRGRNDRFLLRLGGRVQFRYAEPFEDDPLDPEELGQDRKRLTRIRRARFRASGHVLTPKLTFAYQYDLVNTWLLDARINYEVKPWLQVRFGQWKADYNRERVASSGQQHLVERSIVNRVFTIDRQNGLMVLGRIGKDRRGDSEYWVGVFNGGGRSRGNDDRRPMWMARYEWNALGGGLGFAPVDLERSRKVRASLAVAASGNQSALSRFSSDGGGQVDDLPDGAPGQYRLSQAVAEAALAWRGVSIEHEYHWKRVTNVMTGDARRLDGFYVQGGAFLHELWPVMPRPLELAARVASVDPDRLRQADSRREFTLGANWFLNNHRNKLSVDASRLQFETPAGERLSSTRVRLQWDVSF